MLPQLFLRAFSLLSLLFGPSLNPSPAPGGEKPGQETEKIVLYSFELSCRRGENVVLILQLELSDEPMRYKEPAKLSFDPSQTRTDPELGLLQQEYRELFENGLIEEAEQVAEQLLKTTSPDPSRSGHALQEESVRSLGFE